MISPNERQFSMFGCQNGIQGVSVTGFVVRALKQSQYFFALCNDFS